MANEDIHIWRVERHARAARSRERIKKCHDATSKRCTSRESARSGKISGSSPQPHISSKLREYFCLVSPFVFLIGSYWQRTEMKRILDNALLACIIWTPYLDMDIVETGYEQDRYQEHHSMTPSSMTSKRFVNILL